MLDRFDSYTHHLQWLSSVLVHRYIYLVHATNVLLVSRALFHVLVVNINQPLCRFWWCYDLLGRFCRFFEDQRAIRDLLPSHGRSIKINICWLVLAFVGKS